MKQILFIFSIVVVFSQQTFAQAEFSSGVKIPTMERLAKNPLLRIRPKGLVEIPSSWDLAQFLPQPRSQGNQGSCTSCG